MPSFLRRFIDLFLPTRHNAYRPRLLRRPWLIGMLGLALACESVIVGDALIRQGPDIFLAAVVRSDVVTYTGEARVKEGGQPLVESEALTAAAQAKAEDMASKGYFSHAGPDGEEPWVWIERAGYEYRYAGENLAVRFDDSKNIVDAWMNSPGHRANIVKPQYAHIGVGVAQGYYKGGPATFVVQYFAAPASAVIPAVAPAGASSDIAPTAQAAGVSFGDPQALAALTLATVAAILVAVLLLTFFVRIQVQPTDLLLPASAAALIAITFLAANAQYLPGSQTAAVALNAGGEVTEAAAIERAPRFPAVPERQPAAPR